MKDNLNTILDAVEAAKEEGCSGVFIMQGRGYGKQELLRRDRKNRHNVSETKRKKK